MPDSSPAAPHTALGRLAAWVRRPLLAAFRVTPESRAAVVQQMLTRQVHGAPMYWLQLMLAMAIATLGLALGSTVVVIGAMLISPLMGPIVELGMGLVVGLPGLAARSLLRVAASVALVVLAAALITSALPFQEVTAPIAARASPTALDLLIAICCALMASFSTVVAGSAMATTAAGTALAIALVPPLCVVGFGLGTGQFDVARGAALLFTANFSAIMLFAVLTFTAFGFGEIGQANRWALGAVLRIAMPLLLLGLVYVPLRQALSEVAWEVHTRQAIRAALDPLAKAIVQSEVEVGRHAIHVKLVVVGDPPGAQRLQRRLTARIASAAGVSPTLEVVAVPDAEAVRRALSEATAPRVQIVHDSDLRTVTERLGDALSGRWPGGTAGALVGWDLESLPGGAATVGVAHFGDELGAAATDILGRDLSDAAGQVLTVDDVVLPHEPLTAPRPDGPAWLARLVPLLGEVSRFEALEACLGVPSRVTDADGGVHGDAGGSDAPEAEVRAAVLAAAARVPDGRARVASDALWSLRIQVDPCPGPDAGTDAGALEGGPDDAGRD